MKITDLKKELENKQKKELIYIITELYKLIVKTKKYACNVDDIIFGVKNNEKEVINIEQLYEDINTFIELAYGKCYLIPNRYVQKKDRSKWRFKVKRYYKELYGNYSLLATKSVLELYNMLSYGCAYYIFSTNDPFKSCGIIQCEMLSYVFKSVLFNSESEDNINLCIDTLLDSNLDYETSYTCLINEFVLNLKTNISKDMAINLLDKKRIEINNNLSKTNDNYENIHKINNIAETILRLNFSMLQYDFGINYFINNYIGINIKEVYYQILEIIKNYGLIDIWIDIYEKFENKIEFNDELKKMYEYVKKNNEFLSKVL